MGTERTDCAMRLLTHEIEPTIPKGMAALTLDNNGWVGSNNGYPGGQPALFKIELAREICEAWWYFYLLGDGARKAFDERRKTDG